MEEKESTIPQPIEDPEALQALRLRQATRLIRLATDFEATVTALPNGQQYIEEQRAVARIFRNSDPLNIRSYF